MENNTHWPFSRVKYEHLQGMLRQMSNARVCCQVQMYVMYQRTHAHLTHFLVEGPSVENFLV